MGIKQGIYSLVIVLKTYNKSIVTLSNKSLYDMSYRIQRLMLRLQKYILVSYRRTPGKYVCIADTLSRGTFKQKCITDNSELSTIIYAQVNMIISSFPATDKQLVKFANYTKNFPMLHAVMKCILYGCKMANVPHMRVSKISYVL